MAQLIIKGLQKTSLIDFPGNICSVIFVAGCNFRCPYCQNPELVLNSPDLKEISDEEIFNTLESRKKFIDGVCISGGEPTIYKSLPEFCGRIKKKGFLVKIDTNGSNPEMLRRLIDNKLVDFIAMDIKGPINSYDELTESEPDKDSIKTSIRLIMGSGLEYDFRMTVVPGLISEDDMKLVGQLVRGAKRLSLQQFNNKSTLDRRFQNVEPYPMEKLERFREILKPYVGICEIKGN